MCIKNMVAIAITLIFIFSLNANAANLQKISKDAKLQSALSILEQTGSQNLVNNLENHKIQIRFYDLYSLSYEYARHYAMRVETQEGKQYILINSKFENAPTEAIACLVAHEAIHNLPHATFSEEVMATTIEAKTWLQLRDNVPDYATSTNALVKRLNRNANKYLTSNNAIANSIANNPTYKKQFHL